MKSRLILFLLLLLSVSNSVFGQLEEQEDSLVILSTPKELNYVPAVHLRFGSFHGFGSPHVFNQVPFTKGVSISLENKHFLFALEMDFFKFKNEVDNRILKDHAYHIKGAMNVRVINNDIHSLYLGAALGRLESFRARYSPEEYDPELDKYNLQRYWVASPQLSYSYLLPFYKDSKRALKLGAYISYSAPFQGYYPTQKLEILPERKLWYLDGALQVGVSIGITQLRL